MKILLIYAIFIIGFTITGISFANCVTDYIKSKTSDGSVLILGSGTVWEVDSIDRINSTLWLPMDDVIVCDDDYIVHKEDGEKVGVKQVR